MAAQAECRVARFGDASWGRAAGLLHDLGKYSARFQARLQGDPSKVDHATTGAQLAAKHYPGSTRCST